jgi:beta-N-acetylhexosaminidase
MTRVQGILQGTAQLSDASADLLHRMLRQAANKTILIAMGTPYIAASFPEVQTYLCTFSNATVSEMAAVKALFGEIEIHGHLPVSIPGIAARGMGLVRAAGAPTASAPGGAKR